MRTCLIPTILGAAAATALASPAAAQDAGLDLVCHGVTRAYQQAASSPAVFNNRGGPAGGLASAGREVATPDEFRVRVAGAGGGGRVAPPPSLVPFITGPGLGDGWWGLKDVTVSDSRIIGTYSHSLIYSPRVTIDRLTGAIEVRALAGAEFSGVCEPADDAAARRF